MDIDLFFNDIELSKSTPEIIKFTEYIVAWKVKDMEMFPDDVLNYLIQSGAITESEVLNIIIDSYSSKKSLDISLPKKYNI